MSDNLTRARTALADALEEVHEDLSPLLYAAAAAHAAVDAAETARAMHTTLEGVLQAVASMEALLRTTAEHLDGIGADLHNNAAWREAQGREPQDPAPDAPATPQVREVWEDVNDGERVRIVSMKDAQYAEYEVHVLRAVREGQLGKVVTRAIQPRRWRRVSPAPAPLTEREVTAEAEVQGVPPASDAEVDEALSWTREEVPQYVTPEMAMGLISRVRAEQARAEVAEKRSMEVDDSYQRVYARAEAAEARVALMRPVVEAAQEFTAGSLTWTDFSAKVSAYREATRGE